MEETVSHYHVRSASTPAPGLLDPQGKAIQHALALPGVRRGRRRARRAGHLRGAGRGDRGRAPGGAEAMARKLLANPVTEDFEVAVLGSAAAGSAVMRIAVVTFPGSNCDYDCYHAVKRRRGRAGVRLAPGPRPDGRRRRGAARRLLLRRLPAGRRHRPLQPGHGGRRDLRRRRRAGPGHLQRLPDPVRGRTPARAPWCATGRCASRPRPWLRVENADTMFTRELPRRGRCCACRSPTPRATTRPTRRRWTRLEGEGRVVFRYVDASGEVTRRPPTPTAPPATSPGIVNEGGNVLGMMPHPERAMEAVLGSTDGRRVFVSPEPGASAPAACDAPADLSPRPTTTGRTT